MLRNKKEQKFKKLLSLDKIRRENENLKRDSISFVEVEPILIGYEIHLELIEAYKNKEEGLNEAIITSSEKLIFSEKAFYWRNFKKSENIDCHKFSYDYSPKEYILANYFDESKKLIRGKLKLSKITDEIFDELSEDAKKYFVEFSKEEYAKQYRHHYFRFGEKKHRLYHPVVQKAWLKEKIRPIYRTKLSIPNSDAESVSRKLENFFNCENLATLYHSKGRNFHYKWYSYYSERKTRRAKLKEDLRKIRDAIDEIDKIID